jgi:hypothetical protein
LGFGHVAGEEDMFGAGFYQYGAVVAGMAGGMYQDEVFCKIKGFGKGAAGVVVVFGLWVDHRGVWEVVESADVVKMQMGQDDGFGGSAGELAVDLFVAGKRWRVRVVRPVSTRKTPSGWSMARTQMGCQWVEKRPAILPVEKRWRVILFSCFCAALHQFAPGGEDDALVL